MTPSETLAGTGAPGPAGATGAAGATGEPAEAEGLQLPVPEEPVDLGVRLRDGVLAGGDLAEAVGGPSGLGPWLWEAWGGQLAPAGIDAGAFLAVAAGYRREIWFWLLGDRGWAPMIAGLAGRLARRLPVAPS